MRTCAVTGATGGIGAATVRAFLQRGDRVLAIGRSAEQLEELRNTSTRTGRLVPVVVDLAEPFDLTAEVAGLNRLDALIHCAGVADVASVEESTPELWQRMLTVNVTAAAELTRVALPALRTARGAVVFVNMVARATAVPRWAAYVASKAALTQLADVIRTEERATGVRVTSIYPGATATELLAEVRSQFGGKYNPGDCILPETLAAYVLLAVDAPPDAYLTDLSVSAIPGALRER